MSNETYIIYICSVLKKNVSFEPGRTQMKSVSNVNGWFLSCFLVCSVLIFSISETVHGDIRFPEKSLLSVLKKKARNQKMNNLAKKRGISLAKAQGGLGSCGISGTIIPTENTSKVSSISRVSVIDTFGYEVKGTYYSFRNAVDFEFTGLHPGTYTVYIEEFKWYLGNTEKFPEARYITLTAGQTSSGNNITLPEPDQEKSIVISGNCYIGENTPAPTGTNVSLTLIGEKQGNYSRMFSTETTDPSGSFSLRVTVPDGKCYIMVSSTDGFASQWWDGSSVKTAQPSLVAITGNVSEKKIYFSAGGVLSGKVRHADGSAPSGDVYLECVGEDGIVYSEAYTDDTTFLIEGIPAGKYYLKYWLYNGDITWHRYYPSAETVSGASLITVNEGQIIDNFTLTFPDHVSDPEYKFGTVTGKITDGSSVVEISADVDCYYENFYVDYVYSSDYTSDGEFSLPVAASEPFRIKVDPEDYYAQSVWYPDNTSFITVSEGEELEIEVPLELKGGSAAGFFRNKSGNKPEYETNAVVYFGQFGILRNSTDSSLSEVAEMTSAGGMRFTGLKPGEYDGWTSMFGLINASDLLRFAGQSGAARAVFPGFTVEEKNTTVFGPVTVNEEAGAIVADVSAGPVLLAFCYDSEDRIAACFQVLNINPDNFPKIWFFQPDLDFKSSSASSIAIPFLPAGDYRLAIASQNGNNIEYQWYGMDEKTTINNITDYSNQVLNSWIPEEAAWITVKDDQVTNVRMSSPVVKRKRETSGKLSFSAVKRSTGQGYLLRYDLGGIADKNSCLTVHSVDGKCLKKWNLESSRGTLVWNNKEKRGVPGGVYLFTIKTSGSHKTVPVTVVR